jgi:hypothetical protein
MRIRSAIDFAFALWQGDTVLTRLGRFAIVLALVMAVGGHWAVLQSVAWVGMTIEFSRIDPLDKAIEKTLDGQHPCNLCQFVAEGKKSERQTAILKPATKLDLICTVLFALPTPAEQQLELTPFFPTGCGRTESPPSPPPRLA